ncbi:hypothetical protein J3R30DRAFT_2427341 [Lentinula aciculospora]|uniref:FHA domain-containing protein n=1 Tax=Lentinula aciculospora TaxID=153920 RepID=A0A9W9DRH3_9AGAR|nr:hypothetical protein J3R30DRAFT_2427341 [Lentinula aciculospora]
MMFDDDIQFLGFNNTARPRALLPPLKSVTGFTLHVEKNGSESAARMIFGKANANIVVVGRKPPQASAGFDSDRSKAMFRCPVVSRAHAKFTFSDSGFILHLTMGHTFNDPRTSLRKQSPLSFLFKFTTAM